jgi:hypothetical protein
VSGQNLEYENYNLPSTLKGELNLVIVPFQMWHQNLVNGWAGYLNDLEISYPYFKYYEVPTLSKGYKLMSFMIDGGMRAGIPDKSVRERTITLYINKNQFKKELSIKNEDTIYLFLINKKGEILWNTEGSFSMDKFIELQDYIEKYES